MARQHCSKKTNASGVYEWTGRDKLLYALALLPLAVAFLGAAYVLSTNSVLLVAAFVALYLITNVFQAACCVGCPYQGRYCPALCGVYLANVLSRVLYRTRAFDQRVYDVNAKCAEIMLVLTLALPVYWILRSGWPLLLAFLALVAVHFLLFMPTQCSKCSYNATCPGGRAWLACRSRFSKAS